MFKKPRVSHIALDAYGSFVWRQMDGKRNIYDISQLVAEEFGKDAEPVIERAVKFMQTLYHLFHHALSLFLFPETKSPKGKGQKGKRRQTNDIPHIYV